MLYHYAYSEKDELIDINDVDKATHRGRRFRCPGCDGTMVARIGEHNEPHFAHLRLEGDIACNSETYLHKLAKKRLVQSWNDGSGNFKFNREIIQYCSEVNQCEFRNRYVDKSIDLLPNCSVTTSQREDLRNYYDTVNEEAPVKGKVADILLSSSHSNIPPLALEVHVKNPVSRDKISTGLRMIEFDIEDEMDIETIIKKGFDGFDRRRGQPRVRFWNFKPYIIGREHLEEQTSLGLGYYRFKFYKSGAGRCEFYDNYIISCATPLPEFGGTDKGSLIEMNIYWTGYGNTLLLGLVKCLEIGCSINNCHLCQYAVDDNPNEPGLFCKAYKKYGTPRNPNQKYANTCSKYWLNRDLIASIKKQLSITRIDIIKDGR